MTASVTRDIPDAVDLREKAGLAKAASFFFLFLGAFTALATYAMNKQGLMGSYTLIFVGGMGGLAVCLRILGYKYERAAKIASGEKDPLCSDFCKLGGLLAVIAGAFSIVATSGVLGTHLQLPQRLKELLKTHKLPIMISSAVVTILGLGSIIVGCRQKQE